MIRHVKHSFIVIAFLGCSVSNIIAQDCTERLRTAQELFDQGLVERIPGYLFPCIEEGFTTEQKIKAYKLVIQSYYFDDAIDEASQTMRKLLWSFPDLKTDSTDSQEFISLFQSFDNRIFLSVGALSGSFFPFPTSKINSSSYINNMITDNKYTYVPVSFQMGLNVELFFFKNLSVSLDAVYTNLKYQNIMDLDPGGYNIHFDYDEYQSMLEFPILFHYNFPQKRLQPFVNLGSLISYDLSAKANVHYNSTLGTIASEKNIDVRDQHYAIGLGVIGGGGIRYYLKKGYLSMNVNYCRGISYNYKENARVDNAMPDNDIVWEYLYSEPNFTMSRVTFSIGYSLYFNRITKKK
jgi:hypothetical protein